MTVAASSIMDAEAVKKLAPDEASLASAVKLQSARHWKSPGCYDSYLWGECQGSALYQIKVELEPFSYHCNCPSRKFPCKHVLGLLLLASSEPHVFIQSAPPAWMNDWLNKRKESAQRKAVRQESSEPVDVAAQEKRVEQRQTRVQDGLDRFELWLHDLIRGGLAGVEQQGQTPWVEQSRRLVDAQAPALAARVRKLGDIPGSHPNWPTQLLQELGRIKLGLQANRQREKLPSDLVQDIRQWLGWTVASEAVEKEGERIADTWMVLGQWVEEDDRLTLQRTWCMGKASGQTALLLQFAVGRAGFTVTMPVGTEQVGTMIFYPGASRLRALWKPDEGVKRASMSAFPGSASIGHFLHGVAEKLAAFPWLDVFPCNLQQVQVHPHQDQWYVTDITGQSLPMTSQAGWRIMALSGGNPVGLAGEWDGNQFRPLGMFHEGRYRLLP
ncbi:MAG: SWIM zinc finger family protein [Planctomycetia bacterium]|nr:SWIM zinc finger family protein [Planctomycetia bacterium]